MWSKGKRAVFRQILSENLWEAQNYHFEDQIGHFDAKVIHFVKLSILQQKWPFRSIVTVFDLKVSKMKAVFFVMNSLCGLKANEPFSAKSWPGTLWKLKLAIWGLQITILSVI